MKYRKKPIEIEAVQWIDFSIHYCPKWLNDAFDRIWPNSGSARIDGETLKIATLEGIMVAQFGDYIIRGVKGELYPCKLDIFEMTYDLVQND